MNELNIKSVVKDFLVIVGVLGYILVVFFNYEKYCFFVMLMTIGVCSIRKVIKNENRVRNIMITLLCFAGCFVDVVANRSFDVWYDSDSAWYWMGKIVANVIILFSLCFSLFSNLKTDIFDKNLKLAITVFVFFFQACYAAFVLHLSIDYTDDIQPKGVINDIIYSLLIIAVVGMVAGNFIKVGVVWDSIMVVFCIVNHYVYEFRGKPIAYNDFAAAGTAKNVATGYSIQFSGEIVYILLSLIGLLICIINTKNWYVKLKFTKVSILMRILGFVCGLFVFCKSFSVDYNNATQVNHIGRIAWDPMFGYNEDGAIKTIFLTRNCTILHKPNGYSEDKILKAVNELEYADNTFSGEKPKNIIVIMNETWADLSNVLKLDTNIEYNSYYKNLDDNVIKGNVLTSVWGGGTCNSEYEVLTGNSMYFTPGTYPYQTFIDKKTPSIVSTLEAQGYHTTAIHPLSSKNWNRDDVYQYLNFDETHFEEIIEEDALGQYYQRGLLSDQGLYYYIEDMIDVSEYEYNFVFAVTIQNHGGYLIQGYESEVECLDYDSNELNQYLGLIKQTDDALEQLIEYYRDKEPTMIVMFGDHLPRFSEELIDYTKVYEDNQNLSYQEKIYQTPYLIWKNYGDETVQSVDTSLNFLGSIILEQAHVSMPMYNQYLIGMMGDIRAMNVLGYQDVEGEYHSYNDMSGKLKEKLNLYKMMMYDVLHGVDELEENIYYLK